MDQIENISASFEKVEASTHYMKEQLCKMKPISPKIEFQNCHIACARNGGMMAFVRMAKFLILETSNPIKDSVRVFFQDGSNEKRIKFKWNEENEIVLFDFTDDEQLYAIIADGTVYKFHIFNSTVIKKETCLTFQEDKIISAKLFEKGFVCLTEGGSFYLVKDFKNNLNPVLFFPKQELLPAKEPVQDYVFVPSSTSQSHCIELFFSLKGDGIHGLFKVKDEPDHKYGIKNPNTREVNGVYYAKNIREVLDGSWKPMTINSGRDEPDEFGQIKAIALSTNSKYISFYNSKGFAFCTNTEFDRQMDGVFTARFTIDSGDAKSKEEIAKMITFSEIQPQFMYCGDDAVCLAGGRHVLVAGNKTKTLVNKMLNKPPKSSQLGSVKSIHCIPECDGTRVLMNDGIYFISKVPSDVYDACYPFSETSSKKLIGAFKKANDKEASCDKDIREIENNLPEAVKSLQTASAFIWKKEAQILLLRAAQHGKNFVQKDTYNFEQFVEICKNIRIVNNLRESDKPRLITYKQYVNINPRKNIIKKLLKNHDFYLAYEISQYLDFNVKKVYEKYAIAEIKASTASSHSEETDDYLRIYKKIQNVENISYIKLAKKAFKYKKDHMGLKFLENEKSILTKIPQYLELKKWDTALELAFQTHDSNVLLTVFDKIINVESVDNFCEEVRKFKSAEPIVIEYLKKNLPDDLPSYLLKNNNFEELFFFYIEQFFKSPDLDKRYYYISQAKDTLTRSEKVKDSTFDYKFYRTYVKDLESSLIFKRELLEDEVIKQTDVSQFDNSVYDCYKAAIKNDKFGLVEIRNNKCFNMTPRKLNVLRINAYAEAKKIQEILAIANNPAEIKKANLTYLNFAEIFIELHEKERAADMIKRITEIDYFDYKIEMLKYIEKYADALDIVIKEKGIEDDKKTMLIREILMKNPDLRTKANELLNANGVNIKV